eukprot:jgi/Psemu1/53743/gm1.53743_g
MDRVPIARHHTNCPTNVKKDFLVAPIHNLVMQWSLSSLKPPRNLVKADETVTLPSHKYALPTCAMPCRISSKKKFNNED